MVERPEQLFVGDVDADHLELVEALCDAVALPLERAPQAQGDRSAIVLLGGNEPTRAVVATLEALECRGVPFGILQVRPGQSGEFSVLKTLLISEIVSSGAVRLVGRDFARPTENVPSEVASDHSPLRVQLSRAFDILGIAGHGNPQDWDLGPGGILCALQGASSEGRGAGHLSCFHDGKCLKPQGPGAELLAMSELAASILIACGCYTAPLGPRWASPNTSLLRQWFEASGVGGVFSCDMVLASGDEVLLLTATLLEGLSLSSAAARGNQYQRAARYRFGVPVGPFVCLGNPRLRLTNAESSVAVVQRVDGKLRVDMSSVSGGAEGLVTKIPLQPAEPGTAYQLHGVSARDWLRGVALHAPGEHCAYIWTHRRSVANSELDLEALPGWESQLHSRQLNRVLSNFGAWIDILQVYSSAYHRDGKYAETVADVQAELLAERQRFGWYCINLRVPPGQVRAADHRARALEAAIQHIDVAHDRLRDALIDVIAFDDLHEPKLLIPVAVEPGRVTEQMCACGGSKLCEQVYRPLDERSAPLRAYGCACSEAGVDFGESGVSVELDSVPLRARPSEEIRVRLTLRSADCPARIGTFVQLRSWGKDRRMAGPIEHLGLEANEIVTCEVPFTCPDVRRGVYVLWICVFANASCIARRVMFDVEEANPSASSNEIPS